MLLQAQKTIQDLIEFIEMKKRLATLANLITSNMGLNEWNNFVHFQKFIPVQWKGDKLVYTD